MRRNRLSFTINVTVWRINDVKKKLFVGKIRIETVEEGKKLAVIFVAFYFPREMANRCPGPI
jgi:hypothetical protein